VLLSFGAGALAATVHDEVAHWRHRGVPLLHWEVRSQAAPTEQQGLADGADAGAADAAVGAAVDAGAGAGAGASSSARPPLDAAAHPVPDRVLHDADGRVWARYGVHRAGTAYLLRPDQHVAARWINLDAFRLNTALNRVLARA
jgi:hypothetical protein